MSLNAIIGENGIISNAENAKREMEEADLWEQIQMILVDAEGRELEGQDMVDFINEQFEKKNLNAKMGLREGGYEITYGIYSRNLALLNENLRIETSYVAVEGTDEEWDYETKKDGTLKITNYKKPKEGEIIIPNVINGTIVTEVGDYLFDMSGITSVRIPDGIKRIGNNAFSNCEELNCKIEFPHDLKEIGDYGFYGCSKITGDLNVIINQKIQMGKNVFGGCKGMTGDIQVLMSTLGDDVEVIEEGQFSGFSGVTGTLVIPSRITEIKKNAFYGCSGIEGLEFENEEGLESKLTAIGDYAFYNCNNISNAVTMPKSLTTIGNYSFSDCAKISGLDLNDKLTSIGQYAFANTSGVSGKITLPFKLAELGQYSFNKCGLEELEIVTVDKIENEKEEDIVFNIGDYSFYQCSNLSSITCTDNPQSNGLNNIKNIAVGKYGFYQCRKLTNIINNNYFVTLGYGCFWEDTLFDSDFSRVTEVGDWAFGNCSSLSHLPSSQVLTSLGGLAFNGCTSLSMDLISYLKSNKITSIGQGCFQDCANLYGTINNNVNTTLGRNMSCGASWYAGTKITFQKTFNLMNQTRIEDDEFNGVTKFVDENGGEVKSITIPENITYVGARAFSGCTSLESVTINADVTTLGANVFMSCTALNYVKLPDNLVSIPSQAFWLCDSLKNITLPDSVKTIFNGAFDSSGLESINFTYVEKIGFQSFQGTKLKSLDLCNVTSIEGWAFNGCSFSGKLTVPESVKTLSGYAFENGRFSEVEFLCEISTLPDRLFDGNRQLKKITFKNDITSFGNSCFENCSGLNSVVLKDWSKVKKIGSLAFSGCSAWKETIILSQDCTWDIETSFKNCPVIKRKV